jgi:hypothetical protein
VPEFVHAPALVYATAKPELAEAATVKFELYAALDGAGVVNVIDWLA